MALLYVTLLSGCAVDNSAGPRPMTKSDQASIHAIKSEEIKRIMHSLHYEVYSQERNVLEVNDLQIRHTRRLADKLEQMSSEIVETEVEGKGLGLDRNELAVFRRYVDRLNDHAVVFWRIADEGRTESLAPVVTNLVKTCDGCHSRFRSAHP